MSISEVYSRSGCLPVIKGETYAYKKLCQLFEESRASGSTQKKYQLREWRRFFAWDNPTKQKYRITEVYSTPKEKEDGRKQNGGAREGAGAKQKLSDEFEYLSTCFVSKWVCREIYDGRYTNAIYFTNTEISEAYGLYGKRLFRAKQDFEKTLSHTSLGPEETDEALRRFGDAWLDVFRKLGEKRRSMILNKLARIPGLSLESGIIATRAEDFYEHHPERKEKDGGEVITKEHRDDFLERWEQECEGYLAGKRLRNVGEVAELGLWQDMVAHISKAFPGYERVEKVHKLRLIESPEEGEVSWRDSEAASKIFCGTYDLEKADACAREFNRVNCDDVAEYFISRLDDPRVHQHIIAEYVRLDPSPDSHPLADELESRPDLLKELTNTLECSEESLLSHIYWLGTGAEDMLDAVITSDVTPSVCNWSHRRRGSYWMSLRKVLNGGKAEDEFRDERAISELFA